MNQALSTVRKKQFSIFGHIKLDYVQPIKSAQTCIGNTLLHTEPVNLDENNRNPLHVES